MYDYGTKVRRNIVKRNKYSLKNVKHDFFNNLYIKTNVMYLKFDFYIIFIFDFLLLKRIIIITKTADINYINLNPNFS
jgi:hypothetical protein